MKIALFRDNTFTYFRDLAAKEWTALHEAMLALGRFQHDYEIYRLVLYAWGGFSDGSENVAKRVANGTHRIDLEKQILNRTLLNFISTGKAFVDHTRFALIKRFGEDSEQYQAYDAVRRETYDGSAAYRLVDSLRNYIVHRRLPIDTLTTDVSRESLTAPVQSSIKVLFGRDALLEDDRWSARIKADLRDGPKDIDALAVCEEYFYAVTRLADMRFAVERETIEAPLAVITRLEEETRTGLDTSIAIVPDDFRIQSGVVFRLRWIDRILAHELRSALAQGTLLGLVSDDVETRDGFGDGPDRRSEGNASPSP